MAVASTWPQFVNVTKIFQQAFFPTILLGDFCVPLFVRYIHLLYTLKSLKFPMGESIFMFYKRIFLDLMIFGRCFFCGAYFFSSSYVSLACFSQAKTKKK